MAAVVHQSVHRFLQRELLAEFVKRGKRIFSFEVAACLIPGREVSQTDAERRLAEMFDWRERDGVR